MNKVTIEMEDGRTFRMETKFLHIGPSIPLGVTYIGTKEEAERMEREHFCEFTFDWLSPIGYPANGTGKESILDIEAIEGEYQAVLASSLGKEMTIAQWTLLQKIPVLITEIRELRASEVVMAQQMSHWLEVGQSATDRECQRCLEAVDRAEVEYGSAEAWTANLCNDIKARILADGVGEK